MTDLVVKIEDGSLRGKTSTNRKGGLYYSFLGIPYAKPPVGDLRFKDTQPVEKWEGIRDATKEGNVCFGMQMNYDSNETATTTEPAQLLQSMFIPVQSMKPKFIPRGSEDCLFLNVHTQELPKGNNKKLRPVMLFVHGGAFIVGSSSSEMYGSKFLMCEDIVLVTINYRIGPLGFLSLDEPSLGVPGNAGLKDMVEALKWVQRNIHHFNGDPTNVTIFGESAGGASVHYLLLSPLTKGLFHKVIIQSASATNTWAKGSKDSAIKLAKAIGCDETDKTKILDFLQNVPVEKIYEGQRKVPDYFTVGDVRPFCPVVEYPHPNAIICEDPQKIISSGAYNQVPIIIGHTLREGHVEDLLKSIDLTPYVVDHGHVLPFCLDIKKDGADYKALEGKVLKFYFGNETPIRGSESYITLAGDNWFVREVNFFVRDHIKVSKQPIYFYIFAKSLTNAPQWMKDLKIPEHAHATDLAFLFDNAFTSDIAPGSKDDVSIDQVVKLFTNFAKSGDPVAATDGVLKGVQWKPVTSSKFNYLMIGEDLVPGVDPEKERIDFWAEIFQQIKRK